MKTYKANLESLLAEKQNVSGIRGNVRESLENILHFGYARTGKSSRSGKQVWTIQVANALRKLGIPCMTGNDAVRGGGNGEFVVANAPEFRTVVACNAYDAFIKQGREYLTLQEKEDRLNAELNAFIENPTFEVNVHDYEDTGREYAIGASSYAADYLARHNFLAFQTACLPVIAQLFKENGVEVTVEELNHNFEAWRHDYKSQIVCESGWVIFTACGCNQLWFHASRANENKKTYIC